MRRTRATTPRRPAKRRGPSRSILAAMTALAREARERARAPYSRFKVGAALKSRTGEIVTGCNIENASYGLTMCAERVAVFKAVSEGLDDFDVVAVVADSKRLTPPCGPCRQILWEHCGDVLVHMADLKGRSRSIRLRELLPMPFDGASLGSASRGNAR
ncbi:MAG TPA: cytidine deaminase [Vicinamibacteria bacterium]|nr:cytidine deaminase [Vicinamibacteria bacterium]